MLVNKKCMYFPTKCFLHDFASWNASEISISLIQIQTFTPETGAIEI